MRRLREKLEQGQQEQSKCNKKYNKRLRALSNAILSKTPSGSHGENDHKKWDRSIRDAVREKLEQGQREQRLRNKIFNKRLQNARTQTELVSSPSSSPTPRFRFT
tara:strand:+ start:6989 stop:7303 length:315 start_codon:yes stop_codon:yes gene_type:complete